MADLGGGGEVIVGVLAFAERGGGSGGALVSFGEAAQRWRFPGMVDQSLEGGQRIVVVIERQLSVAEDAEQEEVRRLSWVGLMRSSPAGRV